MRLIDQAEISQLVNDCEIIAEDFARAPVTNVILAPNSPVLEEALQS